MSGAFEITLIHCSDIHLSEKLVDDDKFHLRHRDGHDVRALFALDDYLQRTHWDALVISGDLTRIGNRDSFSWARNWLSTKLFFGQRSVGLSLNERKDRILVTVPGNHDRFNGRTWQGSLDKYSSEFGAIQVDHIVRTAIRDTVVNFHLFDSTYQGGAFGKGRLEHIFMTPRSIREDELDIAVIHHHILQPPHLAREYSIELENADEVAAFMLATGFDAILFGHLHQRFIDHLSGRLIAKLLPDRRRRRRVWKRMIPKTIASFMSTTRAVSYRREPTADGRYPSVESYFEFLYLQRRGVPVHPPHHFKSPQHFYDHLASRPLDKTFRDELALLKRKKVLISMAPSACQAEAPFFGLQRLCLRGSAGLIEEVECHTADFDGAHFLEAPEPLRFTFNPAQGAA